MCIGVSRGITWLFCAHINNKRYLFLQCLDLWITAFSGFPKRGDKIRSGYITPAFLGARNWAEWLNKPCLLGGPPTMGTKSEVATSPLPSWGPGIGRNGYITPTFSGGAQSGDTSKLIHGQFHIGDGPPRHHLWGQEAQKGKNSNKNRGKRVYGGIRYIKSACVYVPLYCLYSMITTQTAHRRWYLVAKDYFWADQLRQSPCSRCKCPPQCHMTDQDDGGVIGKHAQHQSAAGKHIQRTFAFHMIMHGSSMCDQVNSYRMVNGGAYPAALHLFGLKMLFAFAVELQRELLWLSNNS